jgi:hypothetical protein
MLPGMRHLLLLLGIAALLIGCPPTPAPDDDDAADDDDSGLDDDDDATTDDDDGADDDDVVDDDDVTPPLPGAAIGNHPSFSSDRVSDWSGESVAILGDVNGDGFDDFAIGAPAGGLKEQGSAPGQLFLFFGKADADWGPETPLTDADVSWQGTENDDLGFNVIGPGDWNDDGFDDIVVAAPQFPQGPAFAGRLWFIYGRSAGWPVGMADIATDAIEVFPEADNSRLGVGLAAIGDVNGDGLPDFAANSPQWSGSAGRIYVFFGRSEPVAALASSTADVILTPGCSTCYGSVAGNFMAGLGDLNGDGIDDFAIGAPLARPDDGSAPLGRVYVVHGAADLSGEIELEPDAGPRGAASIVVGSFGSGDLGIGLAGGDLDGDGYADLIVGAPHHHSSAHGALYVFLGRDGGLAPDLTPADADFSLEGTSDLESVGYTPATGDFDGDGELDLVVGCPESIGLNAPDARSGRVYLINSRPSTWGGAGADPAGFALATWLGDEYPHWVGESVSLAGDINGDGYDDILVGANKSSVVAERAGQTYLILGGEPADLEN